MFYSIACTLLREMSNYGPKENMGKNLIDRQFKRGGDSEQIGEAEHSGSYERGHSAQHVLVLIKCNPREMFDETEETGGFLLIDVKIQSAS